jgi:hypothetical protein
LAEAATSANVELTARGKRRSNRRFIGYCGARLSAFTSFPSAWYSLSMY